MLFLLDLPNELFIGIIKHLDELRSIRCLALLNRQYYECFNDALYRHDLDRRGGRGVLWAIEHDQASALARFVDLGLDTNATVDQDENSTLLHLAVRHGSLSTVKLLLQNGANINARNEYQKTPLFEAIRQRNQKIVNALAEAITDISQALVDFSTALTPLHAACRYALPLAARPFLELGDDLRAKDVSGKTPLHHVLSRETSISHHAGDDGDEVLETVMILLGFGETTDQIDWGSSGTNPACIFELGANDENPRVRALFRTKGDTSPIIMRAGHHIGRAWMSPEVGEDNVSTVLPMCYRSRSGMSDDSFICHLVKSSDSAASHCYRNGKLCVGQPPINGGRTYCCELIQDSFPALTEGLPSSGLTMQRPVATTRSQLDVRRLIASTGLVEAVPRSPVSWKARPTEPFPPLMGIPLPRSSLDASEKWACFRKPSDIGLLEAAAS